MCKIEIEAENGRGMIRGRWSLWLLIVGTLAGSASAQQSGTSDVASQLREIASVGQLPDLRWPNFSDYREQVQNFYQFSDFTPAWVRNSRPTPQALAIINLLKQADTQGLDPEDYDGSRWADRLAHMQDPHEAGQGAIFDAALTVCLMRYISGRHMGKINPEHFKFGLNVEEKKYDLSAFLRERLVNGRDVNAELAQIGPPFAGYNRTLQALQRYQQLAPQDDGEKLPDSKKPIAPGSPYDGIPRLTRLLRLLGGSAREHGDSPGFQFVPGRAGGWGQELSEPPWLEA
jgi:L,D-transpeptidase YcbB